MPADTPYVRTTVISAIVYAVILSASLWYDAHHMDSIWRYPVAVLPIIPLIFIARASVQRIARLDELHQRIQFNALAMTVLVTALITLTYGFLEHVGLPHISVVWVWPLMAAVWGICTGVTRRRYYHS
ncbi:hypothetical protein [Dyella silvatica]|uniref:hypothetical protein n=1 Tax=Dyella silvatica TaxID=2992128 RepID=UPI00225376BE|nr:hypothetical protein [Dyella silvatica]